MKITIDAEAQIIANDCHLVHVAGKMPDDVGKLFSPPFTLKPSDPERSSPKTLQTEDFFELGQCIYFYAGRAEPGTGNLSLVFSADCENGHTGSATPFDTGGLYHGHIKHRLSRKCRRTLLRLFRLYEKSLDDWREGFAQFLSKHFGRAADYFDRRVGPHPNRRAVLVYDSKDKKGIRAWTFEVRFREDHSILGAVAWSVDDSVVLGPFRRKLMEVSIFDHAKRKQLYKFASRCLSPRGNPDHTYEVEAWVRRELAI